MKIQTKDDFTLEVTTIDYITGEGRDDIRIDIDSKYCSAWIELNEDEARKLRNRLNEWLEE